ncbi:MAG: helix-turn-helix domain-containing protein [Pseudomonadota bacterium]
MTKREIGQEILDGIRAIKKGQGRKFVVKELAPVKEIREKLGISQSAFSSLLGVSMRTLQDWEQNRREPSGAARSLLFIAENRPKVLLEVFSQLTKAA